MSEPAGDSAGRGRDTRFAGIMIYSVGVIFTATSAGLMFGALAFSMALSIGTSVLGALMILDGIVGRHD